MVPGVSRATVTVRRWVSRDRPSGGRGGVEQPGELSERRHVRSASLHRALPVVCPGRATQNHRTAPILLGEGSCGAARGSPAVRISIGASHLSPASFGPWRAGRCAGRGRVGWDGSGCSSPRLGVWGGDGRAEPPHPTITRLTWQPEDSQLSHSLPQSWPGPCSRRVCSRCRLPSRHCVPRCLTTRCVQFLASPRARGH